MCITCFVHGLLPCFVAIIPMICVNNWLLTLFSFVLSPRLRHQRAVPYEVFGRMSFFSCLTPSFPFFVLHLVNLLRRSPFHERPPRCPLPEQTGRHAHRNWRVGYFNELLYSLDEGENSKHHKSDSPEFHRFHFAYTIIICSFRHYQHPYLCTCCVWR